MKRTFASRKIVALTLVGVIVLMGFTPLLELVGLVKADGGGLVLTYSDGSDMLRFTQNWGNAYNGSEEIVNVKSDNRIKLKNTDESRRYTTILVEFPDMTGDFATFFTEGSFKVTHNLNNKSYYASEQSILIGGLSLEKGDSIRIRVFLLNVSTSLRGYLTNIFTITAYYTPLASMHIKPEMFNLVGLARGDDPPPQGESGGDVAENVQITVEISDAATYWNFPTAVVQGPSATINQLKVTNVGNVVIDHINFEVSNFVKDADIIYVDQNFQIVPTAPPVPIEDDTASDGKFTCTYTPVTPLAPLAFLLFDGVIKDVDPTEPEGDYYCNVEVQGVNDAYGNSNLVDIFQGEYSSGADFLLTMEYKEKVTNNAKTKLGYGTLIPDQDNDAVDTVRIKNEGTYDVDSIEITMNPMLGPGTPISFEDAKLCEYMNEEVNFDYLDSLGHGALDPFPILAGNNKKFTVDELPIPSTQAPGSYSGTFLLICWVGPAPVPPSNSSTSNWAYSRDRIPVQLNFPPITQEEPPNGSLNQTFVGRSGTDGDSCQVALTYNDFNDKLQFRAPVTDGTESENSIILTNFDSFVINEIIFAFDPVENIDGGQLTPSYYVLFTNTAQGYTRERYNGDSNATVYVYDNGAVLIGTGTTNRQAFVEVFILDQDGNYQQTTDYWGNYSVQVKDPEDAYYNVSIEAQNWTSDDFVPAYSFAIDLIPKRIDASPGNVEVMNLMIYNRGNAQDTFFVEIDTDLQYTTTEDIDNEILVAGGKAVNITMTLKIPYTVGTEKVDVQVTNIEGVSKEITGTVDIALENMFGGNFLLYVFIGLLILLLLLPRKRR